MWTKENSIFTVVLFVLALRSGVEEVFHFLRRLPGRALRTAQTALA